MTRDEKFTLIAAIWCAIMLSILVIAGAYRLVADAGVCMI